MAVDIGAETLKVGNALASVRIDQMILNLAKGIAWGQYELDKVGVDITKMMGVPGTVSIGGDKISMLEAGFVPSFYHFVDTILEMKMEVNIREEQSSSMGYKQSMSQQVVTETGIELSAKTKFNIFLAGVEMGVKARHKRKSTSAYSRSLDASHSQKFSQDLSASSLMRTKIVPVPPPEILVRRLTDLLDRLNEEAKTEAAEQGFMFQIDWDDSFAGEMEMGRIPGAVAEGFDKKLDPPRDVTMGYSVKKVVVEEENTWALEGSQVIFRLKKVGIYLKVYIQLKEEEKKGVDEFLYEKIENELMESFEGI